MNSEWNCIGLVWNGLEWPISRFSSKWKTFVQLRATGSLRMWNPRWAHPKSHLQDYGVIIFFERIRAKIFEQIRAIASDGITTHVKPTMGPPKVPPPGLWSNPPRDHSACETHDRPTLKAIFRTMGWSICSNNFARSVVWPNESEKNEKRKPHWFQYKHTCLIRSFAKRSRNHNFIQNTFDCTCSLPNAEELFQQSQKPIMITSCGPPSS